MNTFQIVLLLAGQGFVCGLTFLFNRGKSTKRSPLSIKSLLQAPQSLIDLSFITIAATIYSLFTVHSLIISGRAPSPGMDSLLHVVLILLVFLASMLYAWAKNKSSIAIGVGAATTLFLLIMAPGGVFVDPYFQQAEEGMGLFYPQLLLYGIIAGTIFYQFGNPLRKGIGLAKKVSVLAGVIGFGLLVLFTNGMQYYGYSIGHYYAPDISQEKAVDVYRRLKKDYTLAERAKIYRYAQEVSLSDNYRNRFLSTQEYLNPTATRNVLSTERLSVFLDPEFTNIFYPRFEEEHEENDYYSHSNGNRRNIPQFVDQATYQRARKTYITDFYERYDRLTEQQKLEYLYNRVLINHSLNDFTSGESEMNLPAVSVEGRLSVYNNLRIYFAIERMNPLKSKLTKLFSYSGELNFNFNNSHSRSYGYGAYAEAEAYEVATDDAPDYFTNRRDVRDPSEIRFLEALEKGSNDETRVFPSYDSRYTEMLLTEHECLPREYENYLTYKAYQALALKEVKSKKLRRFIKGYQGSTSPDVQQTFYSFLQYDSTGSKLATLHKLEGIDFKVFANAKDPAKVPYILGEVYQYLYGEKRETEESVEMDSNEEFLALEVDSMQVVFAKPRSIHDLVGDLIALIEKTPKKNQDALYAEIEDVLISESHLPIFADLFNKDFYPSLKKYSDLSEEDRKQFLLVVRDPIKLALPQLVNLEEKELASSINKELLVIADLENEERETLLHLMAIDKYRGSGGSSLSAFPAAIVKADVINRGLALIFASMMWLPFYILLALIGAFIAHKLVGRDLLRNVVASEDDLSSDQHGLGTSVEFSGRESVISRLMKLAGRGWSTIAVVGRRGIGKSRVLYELLKGAGSNKPKVSVWINAPSQYSEKDFVITVLERFAFKTEQTISKYLGAKPLSVRKSESSSALNVVMQFVICQIIFVLLFTLMQFMVRSSDLMILWVPLIILDLLAVVCLIFYLTRIQPVNLGNWLQKDRNHNPHAIFMYQETMSVLSVLKKASRQDGGVQGIFAKLAPIQKVMFVLSWMISISSFIAVVIMGIIMLVEPRSISDLWWPTILVLALFIGAAVSVGALYRSGETKANEEKGTSLMSLISTYRTYAESVVNRIELGALGDVKESDRNVIICIDEIDKIVDIEETKAFVRKMKALFEVPGVYYYLSLAEDTMQALYLGTAEGKNEIDSSFDHVVHVAPMHVTQGADIAAKYLESRSIAFEPEQSLTLGFLSLGVARDIFRRVDEALSNDAGLKNSGSELLKSYLDLQIQMAYNSYRIDKTMFNQLLTGDADTNLKGLENLLDEIVTKDGDESRGRVVSQLLLLTKALVLLNKESLDVDHLERIRDIGYRIPLDRLKDIREELKEV